MRLSFLAVLIPFALAGCVSYTETPAPKTTVVVPRNQTVVVPSGSAVMPLGGTTVVCSNGLMPPC